MPESHPAPQNSMISAAAARRAAALFDYGNLVAILLPVLGILWLGASMVVYTMLRHHPNPRVGYYTQWAAYRFYGLVGFVIAEATFYGRGSWVVWLITWAITAAILIPWTVYDLWRIYREDWQDTPLPEEDK